MSYQIYYDRAFIRIGDKYIPLANSGSNNTWEWYNGRDVPEKTWNVLNWKHEPRFLFSESEIKEIASGYDQYNQKERIIYKSRNRCFEPGEFERWIINGIKNAYTIEEYISFGNCFYVYDYSPEESEKYKRHYFKTTGDLMQILDDFKDTIFRDIKLQDNREIYRPKTKRTPKKILRAAGLPEYYILKGEYNGNTLYFIKLNRKGGFQYLSYFTERLLKVFKTEKDALAYLKKYEWTLKRYNFIPEKVVNEN